MFCGLYIVDGHEQPEPSLEILQSLLEYTLQWWPWPGAKGESATVTFSFFLQIVIITPSFYLMWTCQILGHGSRRYPQGHKMYIWSERTNSTLESVGVFFARCIFVQHTNEEICKTCRKPRCHMPTHTYMLPFSSPGMCCFLLCHCVIERAGRVWKSSVVALNSHLYLTE